MGIPDKINNTGIPGIERLIPQKPPFVMIDRLVAAGLNTATGELAIRNENIFSDNGYLREPGLMEFMAQTAAAYTGYRKIASNEAVTEGYIGSVKNLEIFFLPPTGSLIFSEIIIENEIAGYTIITAKVRFRDDIIASCEMRILNAQTNT